MELNPSQASAETRFLKEEIFCLQFELRALSGLLLKSEAERWIPGYIWQDVEEEHQARYDYACEWVRGKKVLDVACGCGYGSYLLAEKGGALQILGGDIDADSIRYGDHRYKHAAIERKVMDATQLALKGSFDIAVSFETIEHLNKPEEFLSGIYHALKPQGLFIVSTPIAAKTTAHPHNPYHQIEWSFQDFQKLLSTKFVVEQTFLQSIEYQKNKWIKKIDGKLRPKASKQLIHGLKELRGKLETKKILRGYQMVVCRKP